MRESIEEFLARGGSVQKIYYKSFAEVAAMKKGDLKAISYQWKRSVHMAKQAGKASGAARRAKAAARN